MTKEVDYPMVTDTQTQDIHDVDIRLAALDELAAAVAIFDADGMLTYANAAFAQLWRFESFGQALGLHLDELWTDSHGADKLKEYVLRGETSWTGEFAALRADGTTFPALMSGKIVHDDSGRPLAITGTFSDLTSSRRAEAFLKLQNDLGFALGSARTLDETLRVALEAAVTATQMDSGWIYLVDADGAIRLGCHCGLDDAFLRGRTYFPPDSEEARIVLNAEPMCSVGQLPAPRGPKVFCGLPIRFEERVLAWISVASHTLEEVRNDCLPALTAITEQLGKALVVAISRQDNEIFIGEATDGFCLVDRTGRFIDANGAYCRMLGYTREEMLGKRVGDVEAGETLSETVLHIKRVKEIGFDRFCARQRHKDGKILDLDISAHYANVRGGVVFAFLRDVTAQLATQNRLAASEARYRAVVESQTELIRRFGADCRLTFVNKAYCRYFAKTRGALLGVDWLAHVPESERSPLRLRLAALHPDDPITVYELRVVLPDGTVRWQE